MIEYGAARVQARSGDKYVDIKKEVPWWLLIVVLWGTPTLLLGPKALGPTAVWALWGLVLNPWRKRCRSSRSGSGR